MEGPLVQAVRNEATRRRIVIHDDNIIRQAIDNIAEEMQQMDALNDNEPPPLVRHNAPPGDAAMMNDIIAEIERLQQERRATVWGPDGQTPAPAPDASAADEGLSVSPPQRTEEDTHPPRGGSRKVKKTKSSKKHPAARRRRSSKARKARQSRQSRKSRTTRRR